MFCAVSNLVVLIFFFFIFFKQYLLDFDPYSGGKGDAAEASASLFDVKRAAKMFNQYVRASEDLLNANLVHYFSHLSFSYT